MNTHIAGLATEREDAIAHLARALPRNDVAFFLQIRRSGELDGLPFVELHNGSILFGISNYADTNHKTLDPVEEIYDYVSQFGYRLACN